MNEIKKPLQALSEAVFHVMFGLEGFIGENV